MEYDIEGTPNLVTPSLLTKALSGHASIFALFGGQAGRSRSPPVDPRIWFITCRVVRVFLWASGASGHSQGLVTAVAVFSSKDDASFLENVQKALKWLFFTGMWGQQL
ncbi:hypothetical protein V8E52_010748 [Russula decolorans]